MNELYLQIASVNTNVSFAEVIQWLQIHSQGELGYVFLIIMLFVLPRLMIRFGIPMALTAFALGVAVSFGFSFYDEDDVIPIFSTL
jgi:Kef-type K+ transport system membrane component KefB